VSMQVGLPPSSASIFADRLPAGHVHHWLPLRVLGRYGKTDHAGDLILFCDLCSSWVNWSRAREHLDAEVRHD